MEDEDGLEEPGHPAEEASGPPPDMLQRAARMFGLDGPGAEEHRLFRYPPPFVPPLQFSRAPAEDGIQAAREGWTSRAWRRLGFRAPGFPKILPMLPEAEAEREFWTTLTVHFSPLDRIRVLVSGRAMAAITVRVDAPVKEAVTAADTGVLPPGARI